MLKAWGANDTGTKVIYMRIYRFDTILTLFTAVVMLLLTGCKEDTTEKSRANEQRYFDLFVASNYPDLTPTESGLFIEEIEEGSGVSPDSGDWVLINYVITSIPSNKVTQRVRDTYYEHVAKENSIYSSDALYGPFKYQHGNELEGVKEGVESMKEGGKSRLMFTSDLGYGSSGTSVIDPYTSLIYDIHLIEVIGDVIPYEEARIAEYLDTISASKITEIYDEETEATMYYIEDLLGTGDSLNNDSIAHIYYLGQLPDERVFDSNIGGSAFQVTIGAGQVIRGWDIGLTYFRRGGIGRLVVPYQLAYGPTGRTNSQGKTTIPPYATLIFDMSVEVDTDNVSK